MTHQHKGEEIVIYRFKKNNAYLKLYYEETDQENDRFKDDCLWLEWMTQEGEMQCMGMRPDEALLISEMLIEGVRTITEGYVTSKPIKSYRIKKSPTFPVVVDKRTKRFKVLPTN